MADEKTSGGSEYEMVWFVLGILAILIIFWFLRGGPERSDLRGIFLKPPAPLDTGEAYGPQFGEPNPNSSNQQQ